MDLIAFICRDNETVKVPRRIIEAVDWMPRRMIRTAVPGECRLDVSADHFRRVVDNVYIDHVDDRDLTEAANYLALSDIGDHKGDVKTFHCVFEKKKSDEADNSLRDNGFGRGPQIRPKEYPRSACLKITVQVTTCSKCGAVLSDSPVFEVVHNLDNCIFILAYTCDVCDAKDSGYEGEELVGAKVVPVGLGPGERKFYETFKGHVRVRMIKNTLLVPTHASYECRPRAENDTMYP